jgi:hypothetical protein
MVKTVPWMARPDAAAVKASLAHHDPGSSGPAQGGANAWVAAGSGYVPPPPAAPSGPPVPVWEQSEEQRRGW